MGHGIMYKDIVPYGKVIFEYEYESPHKELNLLIDPANYFVSEEEESDENVQNKWTEFLAIPKEETVFDIFEEWLATQDIMCGDWTYSGPGTFGRKNQAHGHKWTKGKFTVWLTNTSEYSNIGCVEGTLSVNDEASGIEFVKDFATKLNWTGSLEENHIVVEWG